MQEHRHSIYILFKEGFYPENYKSLDIEGFLYFIHQVVFDVEYFYEIFENDYEAIVKKAQEKALKQAALGKTLYMVSYDPDTVHWLAFKKGYYPLVDIYRKLYANPTYIDILEPFNPKDMIF